jgi:hypothetical protein
MRIVTALSLAALLGGVAFAEAQRPSAAMAPYKTVVDNHYRRLDRPTLPTNAAARVGVLKQAMEDEIHSRGEFQTHSGQNPPFEIVHLGAQGEHQLREVRPASGDHQWAIYEISATALRSGNKLPATLLLPVSGHVSARHTEQFKDSNRYNLVVNGKALNKVAAGGQYVRAHDEELTLQPGKNVIEFWPDGSGGVAGTPGMRTIEIHVK